MKKGAILLLLAVSVLSYAQNDNSQGNEDDYPAVPTSQSGIRPHVWIHKKIGPNAGQANTTILTPSQINTAYGINSVTGMGKGATITIVDAYDAPNAAADLATFSLQWGASCPGGGGTFTKVNQNGQSSPLPGENLNWEVESNLDVQAAHGVAPCANIVLVEANSNNYTDLLTAVSTAATLGSVVSMSWGSTEFSGQTSFDSFLLKSGVTFLASSGDTGGVVEWPSSSTNVIGVGGTNLTLNPDNSVASETAWNGSGGGCSAVESAIAPQTGLVPSTCTMRAVPDISMDGGSASPVYVYISDQGGWYSVYGTSLAVQLAGAVMGLANGLRSTPLNGTLAQLYTDAAGIPSSAPYTANYRDITSGSAGSFTAGAGWDFITGLGSMLANSLVPSYLAKQSSGAGTSATTLSASPVGSSTYGTSVTFTATVAPSGGSGTPTGTVTFQDGGTTLGSGTLNGSGVATLITSSLQGGAHSITASYGGDSNFGGSSSTALPYTVKAASTTTTLTATPTSSTYGQSVKLAAKISPSAATGTVTFFDGATTLGTVDLSSGGASLTISTLTATTHTLKATYNGSANFAGSSGTTSVKVSQAGTSTAVSSSSPTSTVGQPVTFTATVTSVTSGTPTGTVTFKDGTTTLGTGTLSSGKAMFSTSSLAAGSHQITASYGGDSNFVVSTSTAITQRVTGAADFSISASPGSATVNSGGTASYTVTISASNGFNTSVSLTATPPTGWPAPTFSTNPISGGSGTSTMKVATSGVAKGNYTITITGSNGGSLTHSTTVSLKVH